MFIIHLAFPKPALSRVGRRSRLVFRIRASVGVRRPLRTTMTHLWQIQPSYLGPCVSSCFEGDLFSLFVYGSLILPPARSCCRMPGRLRARWWFWSAGSAGVPPCRSGGTDRGRRFWTHPTSASCRKVSQSLLCDSLRCATDVR